YSVDRVRSSVDRVLNSVDRVRSSVDRVRNSVDRVCSSDTSLSPIQKRINVSTDVFSAIQNRNDSTEG
ncbi:hypothetical protein Tco_0055897, partial [Tanacetum coccineum]